MPGLSRKAPVWLPILVLLIAMSSIQSGASLAKSLFPLVGAPGVTALRLALGTLILIAFFKPWRLRFAMSNGVFHVTEHFKNPLSLSINITFSIENTIIARTIWHIHPEHS